MRIIDRRSLHHCHKQRTIGKREVLDLFAKVVTGCKTHAVNRPIAVLTEKYFVEIGLENLIFAVVRLEQHRHDDFGDLAPDGALRREEKILDQLLREGAATLQSAARHHMPTGPRDPPQIKAVMRVKVAVFGRYQSLHKMLWYFGEPHQHAILVVGRIDAADQERLQASERQLIVFGIPHLFHRAVIERYAYALGRLRAIPIDEWAKGNVKAVGGPDEPTELPFAHAFTVVGFLQFLRDLVRCDALPGMELQGPREDARRQRKAPALEFGPHPKIEIDREPDRREHDGEQCESRIAPKRFKRGLNVGERLQNCLISRVAEAGLETGGRLERSRSAANIRRANDLSARLAIMQRIDRPPNVQPSMVVRAMTNAQPASVQTVEHRRCSAALHPSLPSAPLSALSTFHRPDYAVRLAQNCPPPATMMAAPSSRAQWASLPNSLRHAHSRRVAKCRVCS